MNIGSTISFHESSAVLQQPYVEMSLETSLGTGTIIDVCRMPGDNGESSSISRPEVCISLGRLLEGRVSMQVIFNGNRPFFDDLAQKICQDQFQIFHYPAHQGSSEEENLIGFIVNTSKFHRIIESDVIDVSEEPPLSIPYVREVVIDPDEEFLPAGTAEELEVRYPLYLLAVDFITDSTLDQLTQTIDELYSENVHAVDIIAVGAFNSDDTNISNRHFDHIIISDCSQSTRSKTVAFVTHALESNVTYEKLSVDEWT